MSQKDIDEIIHAYFTQPNILIKHQIESFDYYIDHIIPDILKNISPITIKNINNIHEISIHIIDYSIGEPIITESNGCENILTPTLAKLRNFSYMSTLYIDISINTSIVESEKIIKLPNKIIKKIVFGKIPIMVKSKYCVPDDKLDKTDLGGYMIINGNEKVIISQEKIASNMIHVYRDKANSKYLYISETRSSNEYTYNIPKLMSIKIKNNIDILSHKIYIFIHNIKNEIPVFIIFKLLGTITDREIIYSIIDNNDRYIDNIMINILKTSLIDVYSVQTPNQAYEYLFKYFPKISALPFDKKKEYIVNYIKPNIIPHIKTDKNKVLFIGLMINRLLKCLLNINKPDDRDNYLNKRIDTVGYLYGNLTYLCMNKISKDIKNNLHKEISTLYNSIETDYIKNINIHRIIKSNYLENTLKSSLATGNWGINGKNDKSGVSQVLNRLSYLSYLSHMRRICSSQDITGKLIPPRKLHPTQWGHICPSETPEGQQIGIVKNFAISNEITIKYNSAPIRYIIKPYVILLEEIDIYKYDKKNTKILINGEWIGFTEKYSELIECIRTTRIEGLIHPHISYYTDYKNNTVFIFTDSGRCIRPLLTTNDPKRLNSIANRLRNKELSWKNLVINSNKETVIIEYVDPYRTYNTLISSDINKNDKQYTHYEISSALILGVLASIIPFAHHNQSPRNTYQSAMGKQAIGIHYLNFRLRYDTFSHILHYPQIPLITTRFMKYFNTDKMPNGMNVVVAIASYGGYNQEDSVILNRGSIQRGLFNSTFYRSYKEDEKKNQLTGEEDIFCKPNNQNVKFSKYNNYDKLNENGLVDVDTYVDEHDIIIGKIMPIRDKQYKYKDTSVCVKSNENGYIDKTDIFVNSDGFKSVKACIRSTRIPEIGDKFSSRHGQKGTVGMIYDECDMPFNSDGIRPDIIINPHAVPSRMTIAQLMETLFGKVCVNTGNYGDSTVFNDIKQTTISDILEELGYERNGNEVLYSGFNGEQLKTSIFMGPTYYQRLKHMSNDKIHSRNTGPVVSMTRQPSEGRASHGGLRFGEMERDCILSHGSSSFLKERLMDVSDKFTCYICNECGSICVHVPVNNYFECRACNNYSKFSKINIPYSCKILFQELQCMSINTNINV